MIIAFNNVHLKPKKYGMHEKFKHSNENITAKVQISDVERGWRCMITVHGIISGIL